MKHLRSYTIVPNEYYVERDADRQIRSIISDMGRPGYVLVARQMGKTNLLLHTKGCLEDNKNIYVYVDFTTVNEESERECFQNIIDTAIMTHQALYTEESRIIRESRKEMGLSPQQQFTSELLVLLKKVDKLVIILDEIDALTNCSYSDKIFSQIRGHYFQRVNFRELEKLTYILSGVIEPKKIIKDPNISPFNIGEKIYLHDFTQAEFMKFITNIELDKQLSQDLIDYVFYWTKGHPRMTWDVCQEIEGNEDVKTKDDIDAVVKKLYLTSYDHAPIDSIRKQISEDRELARAVIELTINKEQSISEDMRSQLYLAGVTNYSEGSVKFKNPVLEKSLDYKWLLSLQTREQAYIQEAIKNIKLDKDYQGAEVKLTTLLNSSDVEEYGRICFYLGLACLHQFKYNEALSHFSKIRETDEDYCESLYWSSYCYNVYHKWDESIRLYHLIEEKSNDRELRQRAIIAYAEVLFRTGEIDNINVANNILLTVLNNLKKENINLRLTVQIYFDMAIVSHLRGEEHGAISSIDYAINFAQPNEKPMLLHYKLQLMRDSEESEALAMEMIKSLDVVQSKPDVGNLDNKLAPTQYTLSVEIAEILLNYPHLEPLIEPKLKLLYEKKEDAFFTILMMLVNPNHLQSYQDEDAVFAFAALMTERYKNGWSFSAGQILMAYSILLKSYHFDNTPVDLYQESYKVLSENLNINEVDSILARSVIFKMSAFADVNDGANMDKALELYKHYFEDKGTEQIGQFNICTYYFYARFFFNNRMVKPFFDSAINFAARIVPYMASFKATDFDFSEGEIALFIGQLKKYGKTLRDERGINLLVEQQLGKIHNSRKVRIFDKVIQKEREDKFRRVRDDIFSGFADFLSAE